MLLSNVYLAHAVSPTSDKDANPSSSIGSTNQKGPTTSQQIPLPGKVTESATTGQTRGSSLLPLPSLPAQRATNLEPRDNPKGFALPDIGTPSETYQSSLGLATGDGFCPKPTAPFDGICNNLTYQGGPIMHNVQFILLLWAGCGSEGCISSQSGNLCNPRTRNRPKVGV